MKHTALRIALGALVMGTLSHPAFAANEKVTLMVGGMEKQIYLPAKLTEQLGYFKEQGLDVELLNEPAGVDAENELIAGQVQGVAVNDLARFPDIPVKDIGYSVGFNS